MRVLWFNLVTDSEDPVLGFATGWICAVASEVEFIYVVTMRAGRIDVPANVRVYTVGKERGYSELRRALQFYRHLSRIVREGSVDVCFSHMVPIFSVLSAPVLGMRGVPIVTWHAHPSLTYTLRLAHWVSARMVTSVPAAYPYRGDKLTILGQGIDTRMFSAEGGEEAVDGPMILCVGRLSLVKEQATLLRACALVRDRLNTRFRAVLIGGPNTRLDVEYVSRLRHMVRDLGLEGYVEFEPPVPRAHLPGWYRRCAVHVNLTPTGSGDKVALEAMSCGRPSVVANEGFRETLGTWADKLVFRCRDPEDLAQRLEWVLRLGEEGRAHVGRYLRERVVQLHSLGHLRTGLLTVLKDVQRQSVA